MLNQINGYLRFLLARLHMDSLMSHTTLGHIKKGLQNLPQGMKGLNETYDDAMTRIEGQEEGCRELARKVLFWVIHAKRALSTREVQHAVAVSPEMMKLDEDFLPDVEILDSVCAGLVTVDKSSDIIRLVHYTTQEYFEWKSSFPNAETDITVACVTYLLFDTFATGFCATDEEFEARLDLNPLYDYASRNWGYHAGEASRKVDDLILDLFQSEAKMSASSQAMMASENYLSNSQRLPRRMTGAHLAAYFGLGDAILALLKNGHHLDSKDTYSRTPLWWAARNGHEAVVKLLVEKGADVESKSRDGHTPLSWATANGHESVVKLLVEKGADVESKDTLYDQTPLSWAAEKGHEAVVKLLLEKGANVESKDTEYGQTPLSWAAEKGHEAVVKMLLEKGADVESKDTKYGGTPLSWAAEKGHEAIVKLLLENGADVVKLLLEKGPTWSPRM
jgi:ankyrin repeat protein